MSRNIAAAMEKPLPFENFYNRGMGTLLRGKRRWENHFQRRTASQAILWKMKLVKPSSYWSLEILSENADT